MISSNSFNTASAQKAFAKVQAYFAANPVDVSNGFFPVVRGINETLIPLVQVIDADELDVNQFDINPTNVLKIINDATTGFISTGEILDPVEVSYERHEIDAETVLPLECAQPRIVGGRHRRAAILTILELSGLTREDYADVLIRVTAHVANPLLTLASNGSRSMTQTEKVVLDAQLRDIDVQDLEGIIKALIEKRIEASRAMRLIFRQLHTEAIVDTHPQIAALSDDTMGLIGSKLIAAYKKDVKGAKMTRMLNVQEFTEKFVQLTFDRIEVEIATLIKAGKTTIKRDYTGIIASKAVEHVLKHLDNTVTVKPAVPTIKQEEVVSVEQVNVSKPGTAKRSKRVKSVVSAAEQPGE